MDKSHGCSREGIHEKLVAAGKLELGHCLLASDARTKLRTSDRSLDTIWLESNTTVDPDCNPR